MGKRPGQAKYMTPEVFGCGTWGISLVSRLEISERTAEFGLVWFGFIGERSRSGIYLGERRYLICYGIPK